MELIERIEILEAGHVHEDARFVVITEALAQIAEKYGRTDWDTPEGKRLRPYWDDLAAEDGAQVHALTVERDRAHEEWRDKATADPWFEEPSPDEAVMDSIDPNGKRGRNAVWRRALASARRSA